MATGKPSGVHHLEPVTVAGLGGGGAHADADGLLRLSLDAFGKRFDLELEPSDALRRGARTVWIGASTFSDEIPSDILYKGYLRGDPQAWVRISLHGGVLRGMIWTPDEVYYLQPKGDFVPGAGWGEVVAYRETDVDHSLLPPSMCGLDHAEAQAPLDAEAGGGGHGVPQSSGDGGGAQGTVQDEVGVVLVAANDYYVTYGANAEGKLLNLLNLVDGIYEAEVNVSLAASSVVIFTSPPDPFTSTTDANTLLNQLGNFRQRQKYCSGSPTTTCTSDANCGGSGPCVSNPAYGSDLAHMFTDRNICTGSGCSVIGIAWIGGVCESFYGAGVSEDFTTNDALMKKLVAHEMGHNFNSGHDPVSGDPCAVSTAYLMNPCLGSSVLDQFSPNSKTVINAYVNGLGCLSPPGPTATPTKTFTPGPPTLTPTHTHTRTPTRTWTHTPTRTPTHTHTPTRTRTFTLTRTPTRTPTRTNTPPLSSTPTLTRTPTPTRTHTSTPTRTPTSTHTAAPTDTPTNSPATVAGLVLWLDASQISGLAGGAPVATWPDASGDSHPASQASSANRPTYQPNAVNGRPVVRFDGSNDYLTITGTIVPGAQARTVFFVARPDVIGNKGVVDLGDGSTTGAGFMFTPEYALRVNGGNCMWQDVASTTAAAVSVFQLNGSTTTDVAGWRNGASMAAASGVTATIATAGNATVGGWTAAPTGYHAFDGDIAEIVVYNRALSTSERESVQQYLADKYAIALQQTQPTFTPTSTFTPGPATSTPTETPVSLPLTVADLVLWFDAGQISGLSNGAKVTTWNDVSGGGHLASQVNAGRQPTFQVGAINGQPAVRFDGSDDHMGISGAVLAGAQARTVLFVARPDVVANKSVIDLGNGATSGSAFMITPEMAVRVSGGNRVWQSALSTSVASVAVVQLDGGSTSNLSAFVNGTAASVSGTSVVAIATAGSGTVGSYTASPLGYHAFDGDIAEILVYARALSTSERQLLEQYLATKYGL